MKKIVCLMAVFALLIPAVALAEEAGSEEAMGAAVKSEAPGMPGCGKCMKCCAHMMGKATMVAGQDGGVIVLAGNKLQKYDNALNLVKEVTIAMPMPGMMGDRQCPITGMKGMKAAAAAATEAGESAAGELVERAEKTV